MATLKTKLLLRNSTTSDWSTQNPTLMKGEIGIEWVTEGTSVKEGVCRIKIGDGFTSWNELNYFGDSFILETVGTGNTIEKIVPITDEKTGIIKYQVHYKDRIVGGTFTKDKVILGTGSANTLKSSSYGIATIVDDTTTADHTYLPTAKAVLEAIKKITNAAMILKGTLGPTVPPATINSLPAASLNVLGDTYKVIEDGTYSGFAVKKGDLIVCYEKSTGVYDWLIIPSGDDVEDTWRPVLLDSVEKLGSSISSEGLNFKNVTNKAITISWNGGLEFDAKTNYVSNNKNYAVLKDSKGNLYVNVPWSPNPDHRDPGYGKIAPTNSSAVTGLTGNTTQIGAKIYNEKVNFTAANKWIVLAGTESTSQDADVLKFGHILRTSTKGSANTAYGGVDAKTHKAYIPVIKFDEAGHITDMSSEEFIGQSLEADRGLDIRDSKVGHINSITAKSTPRVWGTKLDAYGHATGTQVYVTVIDGGNATTGDSDWGSIA